jgi:hypothetical protein
MLLVDKKLLDSFDSYNYKQQIIDFYNKSIMSYTDKDTIQVDKRLLAELIRDSYKLTYLEIGGVDNWVNYSAALNSTDVYLESYWDLEAKSDSEIIKEYGFKE